MRTIIFFDDAVKDGDEDPGSELDERFHDTFHLLMTVNSSVNFVIYVMFGKKFQEIFLSMFCRQRISNERLRTRRTLEISQRTQSSQQISNFGNVDDNGQPKCDVSVVIIEVQL